MQKLTEKEPSVMIGFNGPFSLRMKLQELARENKMSMSQFIRQIVEKELNK